MNEHGLDRIHIRDLQVRCILGVYAEERREKQDVVINVTLYTDLRAAGLSDRIEDTVDYKHLKKKIVAVVEQSSFFLVERLAQCVADCCLDEPRVERVRVSVDKPSALRFARSVAVDIERVRECHD